MKVAVITTPYQRVILDKVKKKNEFFIIIDSSYRGRLNKLECLIKFIFVFIITRVKNFKLYCSHPASLFVNSLYYSKMCEEINIIEEGVLHYYNYIPIGDVKSVLKERQRKMKILGFDYKIPKGHLSGIEDVRVSEKRKIGWFTQPDLVYKRQLFVGLNKIGFQKLSNCRENTVLILDQPLKNFDEDQIASIIKKINSLGFFNEKKKGLDCEIYLKLHPLQNKSNFGMTVNGVKCRIIESEESIENLIQDINPSVVISFFSSALVNIKNINNDVECIAIGINELVEVFPEICSIKSAFIRTGVTIV